MKVKFIVQKPIRSADSSILGLFQRLLGDGKYDQVRVAVAYMTVSGLRHLLQAFAGNAINKSQWVIGLDDLITHPSALETLLQLENAEVKVVNYESLGFRFHHKVYIFDKTESSFSTTNILGSVNLTAQALLSNGESVASSEAETETDIESINGMWDELWTEGSILDDANLALYTKKYRSPSNKKNIISKNITKHKILNSDDAEVDPSVAQCCWIECGNVTAMGRELEFKAELGLFFGLNPLGQDPIYLNFILTSGEIVKLKMKFQENYMWRLQLNNSIPEVRTGLRPKLTDGSLGRSLYVATFERTSMQHFYKLNFVKLDTNKFKRIRTKSISLGTAGKTSAREYGWY